MEFIVWIPSKKNFFFCRYDSYWRYWTTQMMITKYDPLYQLLAHPQPPSIQTPKVKFLNIDAIFEKTFKGTTCCRPHWVPQLLLYCRPGEIWNFQVSSALTSRWKKIWRRRGQGRLIWRVWTLGEAMGKTMVSLYTGNTATHRLNTQCVWVTW